MSTERGLLFSTCLSLAFRDVNLAGVALFHLSFFGFQRCQNSESVGDEMVVNCDSSLLVIACGDCECP